MRTANELQVIVGEHVLLACDKLQVRVVILDARTVFNRVDAMVSPLSGKGTQWVSCDRLRPIADEDPSSFPRIARV